jgi:hypothetical protein
MPISKQFGVFKISISLKIKLFQLAGDAWQHHVSEKTQKITNEEDNM